MRNKIVSILAARGKTADFMRDVVLRDDGSGPYIERWDEAALGPRPTQEELDAVDVAKIEHNAGIDRNIVALEAKETPRRIAESITSDVGMKWLVENRQKIAALRSQRK